MIDNRKFKLKTLYLASALMIVPNLAFAQSQFIIEDFVGTIHWSQSSEGVDVKVTRGEDELNIQRSASDDVRLSGDYAKLTRIQCKGSGDNRRLSVTRRVDYKSLSDYPELHVSIPNDVTVILKNSVPFIYGSPDMQTFEASSKGCGNIEVGAVASLLEARLSGSSQFTAKNIGEGQIKISGSSEMRIEDVEDLDLDLSGASEFLANNVKNLKSNLSGSSDMRVSDVDGVAQVKLSGATNAHVGNVSDGLDYQGSGSSNIDILSVTGPIHIGISGASDVDIKGGVADKLKVSVSGSSSVNFGGLATNVEAKVSGASDISISEVSGTLKQSRSGSAEINIARYKDVTVVK
ncbi:MAG: DUF2807 domain-containing protein [Litorimonas sp.]